MKSDPFAPFEIYAQYGLSYDRATDTFYYDGKTVLFFDDQVFEDRYVSFTRSVGEIGLRAVRNEKYELTGLRIADNDLFERRRASIDFAGIAESVSEVSINTINSDKAYSIADEQPSGNNTTGKTYANSIYSDPNYVDDTLNGYLNYGVSYDNNEKLWLYKNRPIRVFYDKGITTYIDGSENAVNGLLLNVVRDVSGKILDLAEMTPDEVRSFGIYLPSK